MPASIKRGAGRHLFGSAGIQERKIEKRKKTTTFYESVFSVFVTASVNISVSISVSASASAYVSVRAVQIRAWPARAENQNMYEKTYNTNVTVLRHGKSAPFHILQLLSSSICVQLTRRAIKASRPLSLKSAIGVQLPKQQLPGLRRQNSNFPFSILLPPSPSPYTIRFMILLHLRILRCRYQCRCPTDLWRNEPFRLLAPSALPGWMEIWKSGGVFKTQTKDEETVNNEIRAAHWGWYIFAMAHVRG